MCSQRAFSQNIDDGIFVAVYAYIYTRTPQDIFMYIICMRRTSNQTLTPVRLQNLMYIIFEKCAVRGEVNQTVSLV